MLRRQSLISVVDISEAEKIILHFLQRSFVSGIAYFFILQVGSTAINQRDIRQAVSAKNMPTKNHEQILRQKQI